MSDALRAEWTKLRTIAGTWWLMAGAVALTVAASAGIAASTHVSPGGSGGAGQDPTKLALIGVDLGQAVVAILAVLAVSEEYGAGMIRVTLAAMPRRGVMLGAKAVNIAGLALITGVPAVAGCLIAGRLLLPGAGLDPAHGYALVSIAHGPTLRAAFGSVLYLGLIALLGLGIGTVCPRQRRIDRDRARAAVPAATPRPARLRPLAPAHSADRADDRRARDPGHPEHPLTAGLAMGRPRHPGRMGRRHAPACARRPQSS